MKNSIYWLAGRYGLSAADLRTMTYGEIMQFIAGRHEGEKQMAKLIISSGVLVANCLSKRRITVDDVLDTGDRAAKITDVKQAAKVLSEYNDG